MLTVPIAPDLTLPGATRDCAPASPVAGVSQPQIQTILNALVHDLRQPLSTIELCADYLNLILPEAQSRARQQLAVLHEQVEDANRLIGDALRLLRSGAVPPEAKSDQKRAAAS